MKKILIDNGSLVNILYHHTFSRMDFGDRLLENTHSPLYGFTGNKVKVIGTIDIPLLFGTLSFQNWRVVKFHVISASSRYNVILGRTTIMALKSITSITHLKMKFPTDFGVGEVCCEQATTSQCYLTTVIPKMTDQEDQSVNQVIGIDPRELIDSNKTPSSHPSVKQ